MNKQLARIYYDPANPAGYSSEAALARAVKSKFTRKQVAEWLKTQEVYTLHKPYRKRFSRNFYYVTFIDNLWQADLNDLRSLSKYNDGYKYILTVIDVFSKYAWAIPLMRKTGDEVKKAFENIFEHRKPSKLQTDKGKEFIASQVSKYLKTQNVKYFVTQNSDVKASIVERFNKTLKMRMFRYFSHVNTFRYIDVLQDFVNAYNHSLHSSIKMAPANVNKNNILQVWRNLYTHKITARKQKPKLKVGDHVRISKTKRTFEKGYETNWSDEVFTISSVIKRNPPVYTITDLDGEVIEGIFYEVELQRVVITDETTFKIDKILEERGKGASRKLLVKWKGYPDKFNSWILASTLQS